jgi:hypothetical protein
VVSRQKCGCRRALVISSNKLHSRLWILLSREDRWLDYRDLDFRPSSPWDNVNFEAGSLVEQIEGLVYRGESETIEYKEKLPAKDDDFLKTIAAFANGDGGVLIIGVADNPVEVKGVIDDISAQTRRITNMIRDKILSVAKNHRMGLARRSLSIMCAVARPHFLLRRQMFATWFKSGIHPSQKRPGQDGRH